MKILGIIPARYASTRFPAKALADLGGKSVIQRVYEQASKNQAIQTLIVATDHEKIYDHVLGFGGNVTLTSPNHRSGTDRCIEVVQKLEDRFDYVINIQGDEPFISPELINALIHLFDGETQIATLIKPISDESDLFDPNIVKVVKNILNEAIYFSRATIPFLRGIEKEEWFDKHTFYKHLGIYGYRTDVLIDIADLSVSSLEKSESLEQLRWLENGFKIKIAETNQGILGIDTPEDLEKAKEFMKK
ncbi:3-deoxy-manno-octulosonate cytidylyltransferase [Fulvivirgaceae bacterium BMA12]|uniref:3-deoxy-manno-octulosonate cytidylyltransferase n=1 Tax=Agaribacillus aureus TaxID=3051825 RepID=A0ABT8L360_9BACT|nr:3-deoxy-manno-octulosonate cytidylyltransferase [Fulvivirgaceae bacterium BMA12]